MSVISGSKQRSVLMPLNFPVIISEVRWMCGVYCDDGSKQEIEELSLNSSRVRYIRLRANTHWSISTPSSYGLNNRIIYVLWPWLATSLT